MMWLLSIGHEAGDSLAERNHKSLVVGVTAVTVLCGAIWGLLFAIMGHLWTAIIPWAYVATIATSLLHVWCAKRTDICVVLFLAGIILCPLGVHVLEGGYNRGSFVLLWSSVGPFAGLVLKVRLRVAGLLFAVLSIVQVGAAVAEGLGWNLELQPQPPLWVQCTFFAMNSIGPTGVMLLGACFFLSLAEQETQKANDLLLNILPKHIINELAKKTEQPDDASGIFSGSSGHMTLSGNCIAESQTHVTVMFSDIVGFTSLSSQVQAIAQWQTAWGWLRPQKEVRVPEIGPQVWASLVIFIFPLTTTFQMWVGEWVARGWPGPQTPVPPGPEEKKTAEADVIS